MIHSPRGCAKRDPTSERWRFAGRVALPCPQAKARRLPPFGGALRAINFSRLASLRLVCNPASDQRKRVFTNRAAARTGMKRPSVSDQLERGFTNRAAARTGMKRPGVSDQRERRFTNRAGARTGIQRPSVGARRLESEGWRRANRKKNKYYLQFETRRDIMEAYASGGVRRIVNSRRRRDVPTRKAGTNRRIATPKRAAPLG